MSDETTQSRAKTTLPYEDRKGTTHWEGCFRSPHHHNCAVHEVDRLIEECDKYRKAFSTIATSMDYVRIDVLNDVELWAEDIAKRVKKLRKFREDAS